MAEQLFKTCSKCFTHQPIENFPWKNRLLGIRHAVCKTCTAARSRRIYQDDRHAQIERVKANRESYRKQSREYVYEYLSQHPCTNCGESDPIVLEFHHREKDKERSIAVMASDGYSLDRIQQEINKCDVLCANCHRRVTAKRRGWFRWGQKN